MKNKKTFPVVMSGKKGRALLLLASLFFMLPAHTLAAAKMYFTEAGPTLYNLQRVNTDGTSLEVIVPDDGVNNVHEDMFVDTSTNTLYFVDDRADATPGIYKVSLNGAFPVTPALVVLHDGIASIAFDQANGHIYYATNNATPVDYQLYRCNLDGTSKTTLIPDDGLWSPKDIWLDTSTGTLYIANATDAKKGINKVALNSLPTTVSNANLQVVLSTTNNLDSLHGYAGKIYYNDLTNYVVKRVNFDGSGDEVLIGDDAAWGPTALYVDDTSAMLYLADNASTNSIRRIAIAALPTATTGASALTQVIAKKAAGILVHSENAAPTIGGTAAGYTSNDTATVSPFPAVTIGDADGNNVTTIVTLDTNAKGVFTPTSLTASGFTGTGPYILAATSPATAQTKIRQLVFDPADNRVAPTMTETTTFTISVDDGTAAPVTDNTTTVISTSVNDAPTISGAPATGIGDDVPYSFVPTANDVDGDPLTFSILNKPAWASFNTTTGALSGTPTPANIGTTTGIVISVSDGSLSDSLAAFDLEVYADLDNDNIADSVDTDDDGDGMSDSWEIANGLDPRDASDTSGDVDGDGVSNLDEFLASTDPQVDDYPPMVTPPADLTVDATGLFTEVSLGDAIASDALDGVIAVLSDDAPARFRPGRHTVTWSATDAAGNTGTAEQVVDVRPQASFALDEEVVEGGAATLRVYLNGPAAEYPVSIPFVVSGTADGSDHTLLDGTLTINSGLEGEVSFDLLSDALADAGEQIVVEMQEGVNAVPGPRAVQTFTIVEGNLAPSISLAAEQNGSPTRLVVSGSGEVTVTAGVSDPNVGDVHAYDWSGSDNALVDTDLTDETFTFDSQVLAPGFYTLALTVDDGADSNTARLTLEVVATEPVLDVDDDSDGDGLDDAAEGYGDRDGDGVADYLDAIGEQGNVLQAEHSRSDGFLLESDTGTQLGLGEVALHTGLGQARVTMDDVVTHGGAYTDEGQGYESGLYDFVVDALPTPGQSVRVVVPMQTALPADAVYRKYIDGVWQNFVTDADNALASAEGAPGYCPSPGDSAYSEGLSEGHWCVQLTIEDGGPNDADGTVNHSVSDPGGVAKPKNSSTDGNTRGEDVTVEVESGGGSGSPWLLGALGLLLWRLRLHRREVK